MKKKTKAYTSIVCFILLVLIVIFYIIPYPMAYYIVGFHQKGVMLELAEWEKDYSKIRTYEEAFGVVGMLDYVDRYYTPGEGYRSTPKIEQKLEDQRQKTRDAMLNSLKVFLSEGKEFDIEKWESWRIEQQTERNKEGAAEKYFVEVKVLNVKENLFGDGTERFYKLECILENSLESGIPKKSLLAILVTKKEIHSESFTLTETSLDVFETGQIYRVVLLEGIPQGWTFPFVKNQFEGNSSATFACLKIEKVN